MRLHTELGTMCAQTCALTAAERWPSSETHATHFAGLLKMPSLPGPPAPGHGEAAQPPEYECHGEDAEDDACRRDDTSVFRLLCAVQDQSSLSTSHAALVLGSELMTGTH